MTRLIEWAPAKVNLSLHVGPSKPNGRHDLHSLVTFADSAASDRIEAVRAAHFSLSVEGPFAQDTGPPGDNLVLRAAHALNAALDGKAPALAFRLLKTLPCAAGIGGGSADAAAALRLIARAHGGAQVPGLAREVAPTLGGDVLACLIARPGLMSGEGEVYAPLTGLPALPALLVNPALACPTGPVFAAFDQFGSPRPNHPTPPADPAGTAHPSDLIDWLTVQTTNSLQGPAIGLVPEIAGLLDLLAALPGARLSRMSGSGATCLALFDSLEGARAAARTVAGLQPGWWVAATLLGAV